MMHALHWGIAMNVPRVAVILMLAMLLPAVALPCFAGEAGYRTCVPDRPIPPESVGPISVPFDFPIWPTLIKTEFNILPWVSIGRASVCIPCTCKTIEFPAPCFSLKPIPVWFPWLRPLDVECQEKGACGVP
jgi:hypothetical protein